MKKQEVIAVVVHKLEIIRWQKFILSKGWVTNIYHPNDLLVFHKDGYLMVRATMEEPPTWEPVVLSYEEFDELLAKKFIKRINERSRKTT
jgi:hypothetical protein